MSEKISYVLEVLDGYSKQTKNFKKELDSLNKSAKNLEKSLKSLNSALNFKSNINQASKLANSFYGFDAKSSSAVSSKSSKIKKQFKEAEDLSRQAVISAEIVSRNKRAYYYKMRRDEIDEIGWKIVGVNYGNKRLSDNKRLLLEHSPLSIGRNARPLRLGYSPLSIGRVNRLGLPSPEPITINPSQSGFVGGGGSIPPSNFSQSTQTQQPLRRGGFFNGKDSSGSDRGVSFKNVAKGMGYYRAIDMAVSVPSKIHDVTLQMESLTNTFDALIPRTKGYEGETAESQIKYLREISDKLGVKFSDIADPYRKMMATGLGDKQLYQQLTESVGGYSRLVGMDSGAFKGTMLAFEQMLTKQKIQAQEFNLQTQQMPGVKPIFYEAFRRIMEKKGVKLSEKEVTPTFLKYMEAGALDSVALLREFSKVVKEDFWVDVMKKAQSTQAQENRLSNAFYNLGADIGKTANPTINKTVVGLTETVEGVSQFGSDLQAVFEVPILKEFKDFFLKPVLEGLKLLPSALMDLIKYMGQGAVFAIKGFVTGDFQEFNNLSSELGKKWFPELNKSGNPLNNQFTPIPQSSMPQQEVIVKIVGENLPTGISIKQESRSYGMTPRPRTVIAGGL